jgi:hypothetical protein
VQLRIELQEVPVPPRIELNEFVRNRNSQWRNSTYEILARYAGTEVLANRHALHLVTIELSDARDDVWAWHFIVHASVPARC